MMIRRIKKSLFINEVVTGSEFSGNPRSLNREVDPLTNNTVKTVTDIDKSEKHLHSEFLQIAHGGKVRYNTIQKVNVGEDSVIQKVKAV